ncbi:MAG: restriction endonuclease subunit S [Victivallales bacterium]|jgi:type I restriction enzyme S subunit
MSKKTNPEQIELGLPREADMKKGWQTKTLGEICDIERGGSPRPIQDFITADPKGINWIKISDATASGKYIYKTEEKIKPEGVKRSRMVYEGDFILSNSMSFGRPYIMKTTGCIHDGWLVLHQPKVDPDYLYHALSSDLVFDQFDRLAAGSTVRNLNIGLAKSVEIPYPPLPEQQRIVGILDEAFEGIATAKANAEKNLQNARALFESHLQSVFIQRGEGWVEKPLGDICELLNGFAFNSADTVPESQTQLVRMGNLYGNRLDLDRNSVFYPDDFAVDFSRYILKEGDLIISLTGTTGKEDYGYVVRIPECDHSLLMNQRIAKFDSIMENSVNKDYLQYYLRSRVFLDVLYATANGTRQANLSSVTIKTLPIPLCSIREQEAISSNLKSLSDETHRLETIYQQKLDALEALKKSLLNQAFTGEL